MSVVWLKVSLRFKSVHPEELEYAEEPRCRDIGIGDSERGGFVARITEH